MKAHEQIAVISDIHGNSLALEKVLADINRRQIERIYNLGDSLYGPLEPLETAELLIHLNIPSISGNEDRVLLEASQGVAVHPKFSQTLDQLTPQILDWLGSLPGSLTVDGIFMTHGTPMSDREYLMEKVTPEGVVQRPEAEIAQVLSTVNCSTVLCGHSHVPGVARLSCGTTVVNAGSVGLPAYEDDAPHAHAMSSRSPHAKYALITKTDPDLKIDIISVAYDWDRAAAKATANGRPDWAQWLQCCPPILA
ncbi:MAG: metallophosphoesterase family protein [Myxococcota bacterium]|nr:metallophosphoesterase family protein [Myxococcota bacterium]